MYFPIRNLNELNLKIKSSNAGDGPFNGVGTLLILLANRKTPT